MVYLVVQFNRELVYQSISGPVAQWVASSTVYPRVASSILFLQNISGFCTAFFIDFLIVLPSCLGIVIKSTQWKHCATCVNALHLCQMIQKKIIT